MANKKMKAKAKAKPGKLRLRQRVNFTLNLPLVGYRKYSGKLVELVPEGAVCGAARFTVLCDDGVKRRPYPSQCWPA